VVTPTQPSTAPSRAALNPIDLGKDGIFFAISANVFQSSAHYSESITALNQFFYSRRARFKKRQVVPEAEFNQRYL
jgi:hypothetical protein